jgi:choice-of-anchor B domain-containing protein
MRTFFLLISVSLLIILPKFLQAQDSLNMTKVFHWHDTTIPKAVVVRNIYNEIWGWYDSTKQREYAILGSSIGTHFFDVTDPANAQLVDFVPGRQAEVIHRDYKNKGKYLFAVADEFRESLMVMDMSYLPDSVHIVYDRALFFNQSHNIWIDGDHLYACIPRFVNQGILYGLGMYDISDPENPTIIKEYEAPLFPWGNVHDLYSRNDTAYLNSESLGMFVVDFTNPENPNVLANFSNYPFMGYNHSGWLSADGNKYVMADETHGMPLKYLDVSDLSNIGIDSYLFPEMSFPILDTNAIAHNPIIRDDYVFCSYYYDGVYIWDMSNPQNPVIAAFYDTYPDANTGFYHGNWGVFPFLPSGLILASDMQTGLYVFEAGIRGTAVGEKENLDLLIYPNPVSDRIMIKTEKPLRGVKLTLFDLQGRILMEREEANILSRLTWELDATISPGFYLLKIERDKGFETRKILVE